MPVGTDGAVASWNRDAQDLFGHSPERVAGRQFATLFTRESRAAVDGLTSGAGPEPQHARVIAIDSDGLLFEADVTAIVAGDGLIACVRDVSEQRAVASSLGAFVGARDTGVAVERLAEQLREWIPDGELVLSVLEKDRYRLTHGDAGSRMHALDEETARNPASPLGTVAEHAVPVVVQDTASGTFSKDRSLADAGIGSYVLMPLIADEHVFATLNVGLPDPRTVTPRIVRRLAAVAEAIAAPLARRIEFDEMSRAAWHRDQLFGLQNESVALVTHDMSTPLSIITAVAGSLREEWQQMPEAERVQGLDAIIRNGEKLTRLVEQDLQLALIEARDLPYNIAAFDLASQIEGIVDDFAATAGARFSLGIQQPLPLVRADEQRNWQILANLLANAVKYSPAGTLVDVAAHAEGPMVQVSVRDHGPGIPSGDIHRLFRKFARVRSAGDGGVHGMGLGLYLSKRMVEAQGGRIWVESRLGEGSTFTYTLPRATVSPGGE